MRTDRRAKIALTVAAISLIANYIQFLHQRAQTRVQQMEVSRLHIEHRKEAMLMRAAAFNELVLGRKEGILSSERSGMEEGEYRIEYAVRIPQEKRQEFVQWMASAKPAQFTVAASAYSHESATRLVQDNGREVEELFEKFAIAPP